MPDSASPAAAGGADAATNQETAHPSKGSHGKGGQIVKFYQ